MNQKREVRIAETTVNVSKKPFESTRMARLSVLQWEEVHDFALES